MISRTRKEIDRELRNFAVQFKKTYGLDKASPLLHTVIKDFMLREGKRIRPMLLVIGYLGFAKKKAPGLYQTALSLELLHDFMLIHDDIIDKSDLRRGKPAMHTMLNTHIARYGKAKFSGEDLAIVVGDVMYAMAIDAFLSIKEKAQRKEKALKNFIQAAVYTGAGEFIELICGVKNIDKITRSEIYKIYDYKTAHYTFSSPLTTGAILAGAAEAEVRKLFTYGIYLGRAFQIKDDILGMFGAKRKIGKSQLTDLQEAKKTLLIWYAHKKASLKDKAYIQRILTQRIISHDDLRNMRRVIKHCGSLEYAKKEITRLLHKAGQCLSSSRIKPSSKKTLRAYSDAVLQV